jgi:hypothetical protein
MMLLMDTTQTAEALELEQERVCNEIERLSRLVSTPEIEAKIDVLGARSAALTEQAVAAWRLALGR